MPSCPRYDREQLLGMLHEYCPGAMANLPPPSSFEFTHGSDMLRVGSQPTHLVGREVWVRQCNTAKPFLAYKNANGNHHGITKDQKFQGNDFFGKLTEDGKLHPYDDDVKALVNFVLVYCDKEKEFFDFGFGHALDILKAWLWKNYRVIQKTPQTLRHLQQPVAKTPSSMLNRQAFDGQNDQAKLAATKPGTRVKLPVAGKVAKLNLAQRALQRLPDKTPAPSKGPQKRKLNGENDEELSAARKRRELDFTHSE